MYIEILYSRDVNIQDNLKDIPYLQESLELEDEVRSALLSLPSQKVMGTNGIPTEYGTRRNSKSYN